MAIVAQTYYKDWMNDPIQSQTFNFADSIDVQLDQGKDKVLVSINGKLTTYDYPESKSYSFVYAKNYNTIWHNMCIRNMSDTVMYIQYYKPDGTKSDVITFGQGDVINVVTKRLHISSEVSAEGEIYEYIDISWKSPTINGGIANINWGTVAYDKDALAKVFDRFYAYWFINDPYDEGFLNVLQEQYDLCKEQIDRHYDYIQSMSVSPTQTEKYEFGTKTKTESKGKRTDKSTYGTRDTEDKSFDYPINANLSQANPSKGEKSTQAQVEDQTEYGEQDNTVTDNKYTNDVTRVNNTDPIKSIKDADKLYSFQQYFIDCFVPCFTLFESITW